MGISPGGVFSGTVKVLWGGKDIDYPESDQHFSWRLSELTTVNVKTVDDGGFYHTVLNLTDEDLFDYPRAHPATGVDHPQAIHESRCGENRGRHPIVTTSAPPAVPGALAVVPS